MMRIVSLGRELRTVRSVSQRENLTKKFAKYGKQSTKKPIISVDSFSQSLYRFLRQIHRKLHVLNTKFGLVCVSLPILTKSNTREQIYVDQCYLHGNGGSAFTALHLEFCSAQPPEYLLNPFRKVALQNSFLVQTPCCHHFNARQYGLQTKD